MTQAFWTTEGMAPELSQQEMQLRDRFVKEYLLDYDGTAAAMRIGFGESFAGTYAQKFLQEPYTLQQIKKAETALADDPDAESEAIKRRVQAALLREAYYNGPGASHAARVNALSKLAIIHDMDAPTKIKAEVENRGGVMMVPGIADVDEWSKIAGAAQAQLQKEAEE